MTPKEGYDVLRFIEHNRTCYVSSEYVKGKPLVKYLKYHPCISKEQLFGWMRIMTKHLSQFHKCRGNPCYQYVNPYSVIVSEEREIYFLDMGAVSNEEELQNMQRRVVREYFLPKDEPYYQTASVSLDIYGLGRTFQYLLSESEQEPPLKNSEIVKLQKLISKCLNSHSKKVFQKVSDIQKYIPEYRQPEEKKHLSRRFLIPVAAIVLLGVSVSTFLSNEESYTEQNQETPEEQIKSAQESEREKESGTLEETSAGDNSYKVELGVLYFLEMQDYAKSSEYFRAAKGSELAENLAIVSERMAGGCVEDDKLREALQMIQGELKGLEDAAYYRCVLRGYSCLEEEEDRQAFLNLGRKYLKMGVSENTSDLTGDMAAAYEKIGQMDQAVLMYELQLKEESDAAVKESIYGKMAGLSMEAEKPDQAQQILREGIEEFPESAELRIQYIRIQCQDSGIDRDICKKTIEESLQAIPELWKESEFQKLMKENGFQMEGESVWGKE